MRINLQPKYDAKIINQMLERLGYVNLNIKILEGTTNAVADTQQFYNHSLGQKPKAWLPLFGDVYVPKNGISNKLIDVRSRLTSHPFTIILLGD